MASTIKSLQEFVKDAVGNFLYAESFPPQSHLSQSIVSLIDGIAKYNEEGKRLFPEVIITTTVDLFTELPTSRIVTISKNCEISEIEFKKGLKKCAPLAINGWAIFFEIQDLNMNYGLVSAESSELSPSLFDHTVGILKAAERSFPALYIQNIGAELVQVKGLNSEIHICLNLSDYIDTAIHHFSELIQHIISETEKHIQQSVENYLKRAFGQSLRMCHGCLIGIVDKSDESLRNLRQKINDGVYLDDPIKIDELVKDFSENRSIESNVNLKSYKDIIGGMINSDGITIFTNDSKIIAYNAFIKSSSSDSTSSVDGGARKRAFQAMVDSTCFIFCYFQSQDGQVEIWSSAQ